MYTFHFVKMDIKLGIRSFFCKDRIKKFQDIYRSFWLFSSNNLVIYRQYINYLLNGVYLQDKHIYQFGYCTQMKEDMKGIY